jgi:small-conductance mechanosensitive channel
MTSIGRSALLVTFIAAVLLWGLALGTESDPVLGVGMAHLTLKTLAIAATAVLAVITAAKLILSLANSLTGMPPTGFQRVVIYGLLTFAASFATLQYFGFNLSAVLTTSAIVTAAVGFAMQPTLSSMIGGLALHADRALRIGDCVMYEGDMVRIESMNWRAAAGRKSDGKLVVIPNTKLADSSAEILHADRPHRLEVTFFGPIDHPPQAICDLVREAVSDLALVDKSRAVAIAPIAFELEQEAVRFRIQYWTRNYLAHNLIHGEIIRRIWYVFQRNRIHFPNPTQCVVLASAKPNLEALLEKPEEIAPQLARALHLVQGNAMEQAQDMARQSRLLLFAPDERLIMPEWSDGWEYLLLRGEAYEVPEFDLTPEIAGAHKPLGVERLGPTAAITRVADELSLLIGPYAKLAVVRVGDRTETYEQLCREVALEIPDEAARAGFLRKMLTETAHRWRPGTMVPARRNASGQLASEPSLRADGEVALLAAPAGVLRSSQRMAAE